MDAVSWVTLVIGIATIIASAFISAITASWTIGTRMVTRKDLTNLSDDLTERMDRELRGTGETVTAIRQKVEQVEIWIRDHFAAQNEVSRLSVEVADNRRKLEDLPAILVKVDTLWTFVMDRGRLEARDKGFMQKNSPLVLTPLGHEVIAPILPDVVEYCRAHPEIRYMDEDHVAATLIGQFETRLVDEVCEPNHIFLGACLALLLEALRAERVIEVQQTNGKLQPT